MEIHLDDRQTGWRFEHGVKVRDDEAEGDGERKRRCKADYDRPQDHLGYVRRGIGDFFTQVSAGICAEVAVLRIEDAEEKGQAAAGPAGAVGRVGEDLMGGLKIMRRGCKESYERGQQRDKG